MPTVVADTSVLVAFSAIDRMDVLRGVFGEIAVPPAVLRELAAGDWKEASGALREIHLGNWMRRQSAPVTGLIAIPPANLGAGEIEVVTCAAAAGSIALIDDRDARRFATGTGVRVLGSLGIIAQAKSLGLITSVRPLLEGMLEHGIRFHPDLVARFLAAHGEL